MASYAPFSYTCEFWQPEDFEPETRSSSSSHPVFFIEGYVSYNLSETRVAPFTTGYFQFKEPQHLLLQSRTSWCAISNILSKMSIPFNDQPSIIQEISGFVRSLAYRPQNLNSKTIPVVLSVVVGDEEPEEEASDSDDVEMVIALPAPGRDVCSFVQAAVVEKEEKCVICLEDIESGSEAACLPCSHVYHQNCILKWVERSYNCPLCRFQIPLDQ